MTILVLGDQLIARSGPLATWPEERVLMIEATDFARRKPYHPHKLTLVFAAMRSFRDRLRASGRTVSYHQVASFEEGFARHLAATPHDHLRTMEPPSHGAGDRLEMLVERHGGTLERRPDARFLCSPETFDRWARDRSTYRHEAFYRFQRDRTGLLMVDGDPRGGEYNYDESNRETPPADWSPPPTPRVEPTVVTERTARWVAETFETDWADPGPFGWPTTREQALAVLGSFVRDRLPTFGRYQDAMRGDAWAMSHALLAPALNLGLLGPEEVIVAAIAALDDGHAPIESVEGFVRQVLGWREFLRHVYRREMPDLADANRLAATGDLPPAYWSGETRMACLADAVAGVRRRGYAHHIERLMVLSNIATLLGVRPQALNRWFHAGFVDAYHWVTTANVVGMGTFGTDCLSTKPYVASANYIERMSDHCEDCPYDPSATLGEMACPLNALYWDFLARHEDRLRSNHRMGLVYSHLDDRRDQRAAIAARADDCRTAADSETL